MDKTSELVVAVGDSVAVASWRRVFDDVLGRISSRFLRSETRQTAGDLLLGLLAPIEQKNGWWLAEHAGHATPDRMQRLLRTAVCDDAGVRGDLREVVVAELGHPDAVLVVDETGYLKKGVRSAGVARQYSGTAGRIENSQVAVFLTYASPLGRSLIDTRLYLPAAWSDDQPRRAAAGIPTTVEFATEPQLAMTMIEAALDAGVPARFVAGDEVYGLDPQVRARLRVRGVGYVLAMARNQYIQATDSVRVRANDLAAGLTGAAWELRTCGTGSKGERFYQWAWIHDHTTTDGGVHTLLIRRNTDTGELAFYRCWTPQPVPLSSLAMVAGRRWMIEETFQAAKTQVGLDHYQCRNWTAWHRFALLAMLALAILVITAAQQRPDRLDPRHDEYVPLSVGELRRLIAVDSTDIIAYATALRWSWWRRHHQATARRSHYKRRDLADNP